MEDLLSKRLKRITPFIILSLIIFVLAYFLITAGYSPDPAGIIASIKDRIKVVEARIGQKVGLLNARGNLLFRRYISGILKHDELVPSEAVVRIQEGKISEYFGEIFLLNFRNLKNNQWSLIKKKDQVYFIKRFKNDIYYLNFFLKSEDPFLFDLIEYPFSYKEINYISDKPVKVSNSYTFDKKENLIRMQHFLSHTNHQLMLYLELSRDDVDKYYGKKKLVSLSAVTLLFLLCNVLFVYFYGYRYFSMEASSGNALAQRYRISCRRICFVLLLLILILCFFASYLFPQESIYLTFFKFKFTSIYSLFFLGAAVYYLLYLLTRKVKFKYYGLGIYLVSVLINMVVFDQIIQHICFDYSSFRPGLEYIVLITLLFIVHLIPLLFVQDLWVQQKRLRKIIVFLLVISIVLSVIFTLLGQTRFITFLVYTILLLIIILFRKGILLNILIILLISISIHHTLSQNQVREKREFISQNLKSIFLHQSIYAKFIAREIVNSIRSSDINIYEFFEGDKSIEIEKIWQKSLAAEENIASGIFVLSQKSDIINQYIYQISYLEAKSEYRFPFWVIEEMKADFYNKRLSIGVASIEVLKDSEYLGNIIVQVLDSPELILKHQSEINIFTINQRIEGKHLSYIKIDSHNQVLENPGNIELKGISEIIKNSDKWINFKFMDIDYQGYIFKDNENSIIIYFPELNIFNNFAQMIKIFLFLLFYQVLFYFRGRKRFQWKLIYYSFSIRVFVILILLTVFTAAVFSIFSLNFNSTNTQRKFNQLIYEKGRTAQNIVYNLFEQERRFSKDSLFQLAKMLGHVVSVYRDNEYYLTSNYKKIQNLLIPQYLNSDIVWKLKEKKEKLITLKRKENVVNLFFMVNEYIFDIEFIFDRSFLSSESGNYEDFITSLIFILVVLGMSAAFIFRNKILTPVQDLSRSMAEVEKGNLTGFDKIPSEIDLKSLYLGFNSMVEGIKEQKKSISELSRMKTLIKLGRRVAHEIKNPLTPIKLSAEQINHSITNKDRDYEKVIKKAVNYIIDETEHLRKVSFGFLNLSKMEEIDPEKFDFAAIIEGEVINFKMVYYDTHFILVNEVKNPRVKLDKVKIKEVLKNLVINSIEAIPPGKKGRITIRISDDRDSVKIEIQDNGIGMNEDEIRSVFKEDYSQKVMGTGLGLFIIKRIIEMHKGWIDIKSQKEKGTTVTIRLPRNVS